MNNTAPQSSNEGGSNNPLASIDWKGIFEKAFAVIQNPKQIWDDVAAEEASISSHGLRYLLPLMAIAGIAQFLGMTIVGVNLPFVGSVRWGIIPGLIETIVMLTLQFGGICLMSILLSKFTGMFGGSLSESQSLKVLAYSMTPALLASFLSIIPSIGALASLVGGIYSLVLLYFGMSKYSGLSVGALIGAVLLSGICAGILMFIVQLILKSFLPFGSDALTNVQFNPELSGNIKQFGEGLENANKMLQQMGQQ